MKKKLPSRLLVWWKEDGECWHVIDASDRAALDEFEETTRVGEYVLDHPLTIIIRSRFNERREKR